MAYENKRILPTYEARAVKIICYIYDRLAIYDKTKNYRNLKTQPMPREPL